MAPTVITFCEHGQLKGWQPHFPPTVVKSSISKTIYCFAVVIWNHRRSEYSSTSPGDHSSVTKRMLLCMRLVFFCTCNEGMGMMQYWCRAGTVCCGSQEPRCLEFPEMDSLEKHVEKKTFGSASRFANMGSWKAGSPASNPLLLKAHCNSRCDDVANGKKHIPIFRNKPWRPQLRDQTCVSLHETQIRNLRQRDGIFGKHNASRMQSFCHWRESFSSIYLNASETRLCYLSHSTTKSTITAV